MFIICGHANVCYESYKRTVYNPFLLLQHLNREVTIEDETGKSMPAIDIFAHGIRRVKYFNIFVLFDSTSFLLFYLLL